MTATDAIRSCLKQYTGFRGRAPRSEFWFFVLFVLICAFISAIVDRVLGTTFHALNPLTGIQQSTGYGFFYMIVALALFLPNISATVRRLHDTDRSGWWYWLVLVPIVGAIILLVWLCSRGTPGVNRYGIEPLADGVAETFA